MRVVRSKKPSREIDNYFLLYVKYSLHKVKLNYIFTAGKTVVETGLTAASFSPQCMLTRYLFPHRFKWVGWVLVVVSAAMGLLETMGAYKLPLLMSWLPPLLTDTWSAHRENTDLYAVMLIIGGLLAACSRVRYED